MMAAFKFKFIMRDGEETDCVTVKEETIVQVGGKSQRREAR
jgi:hypothetical protein